MAWCVVATFRRKAWRSKAAGLEVEERMEHPEFEQESGWPPRLDSSGVFGGSRRGRRGG